MDEWPTEGAADRTASATAPPESWKIDGAVDDVEFAGAGAGRGCGLTRVFVGATGPVGDAALGSGRVSALAAFSNVPCVSDKPGGTGSSGSRYTSCPAATCAVASFRKPSVSKPSDAAAKPSQAAAAREGRTMRRASQDFRPAGTTDLVAGCAGDERVELTARRGSSGVETITPECSPCSASEGNRSRDLSE